MTFDDRIFVATVAVSIGVGICVGLGFNDGPGWYVFAKDWQTLLAGALAVLAAYMTVDQMRKTDREQLARFEQSEAKQQQRHRELSSLQLRSDLLRVRRAQHPASLWLHRVEADGKAVLNRYEQERISGSPPSEETLDGLIIVAEKYDNAISDVAIEEAKDLFEPMMDQQYRVLLLRADEIRTAVTLLKSYRNSLTLHGIKGGDETARLAAGVVVKLDVTIGLAKGFADDLTKLVSTYSDERK